MTTFISGLAMLIKQPPFTWHDLDSNTMPIGTFFNLNNRGLETGVRDVATHVLKNGDGVWFAFSSPYH